jgi:DNA repair protein RecO (recombination protein O)
MQSTHAFILHTRPFKETSLLLHVFSQKNGLISLIAKGIKRKNSQSKRAILQPFNYLSLEFLDPRHSSLKTLSRAELLESFSLPLGKPLAACYYINELLYRVLHEGEADSTLFIAYYQTILQLIQNNRIISIKEISMSLRFFEMALLSTFGLNPNWLLDIHECAIISEAYYHYVVEAGFKKIAHLAPSLTFPLSAPFFLGQHILDLGEHYLNVWKQLSNSYHSPTLESKKIKAPISNKIKYSNLTISKPMNDETTFCKKEHWKIYQQITHQLLKPLIGHRPFESRKMWL